MHPFRFLRFAFAATISVVGIGGASVAWADDNVAAFGPGYSASDAPLGTPTDLQIDLRGEVAARCRMTSQPSITGTIDLNRAGNAESRFGLDCNAPFQLTVRSGNGGFSSRDAAPGAAKLVPYEVGVDIDTDAGMNALGWCDAAQMSEDAAPCAFGPRGWSSGSATAINRTGSLALRWQAPTEAVARPAGEYQDTIVIEVAVRS